MVALRRIRPQDPGSNQFGGGCSAADLNNYSTCVYPRRNKLPPMLNPDETAAQTAAKGDQTQLQTAYQQDASAISTYVPLDSMAWPTSLTRQDSAQLEQTLTNTRNDVDQINSDLLNGQSIAQDNQALTSDTSDLQTEFINLSTALGLPPPPAASSDELATGHIPQARCPSD